MSNIENSGENKERECKSCCERKSSSKLDVYDWLGDITNVAETDEVIEVRFKNTRKDYYQNPNKIRLKTGDIVAVESNPGHDIGVVSLTGELVKKQMERHKVTLVNGELRKIYRKAKPADIDKWKEAIAREHETMIRSRQLASDLSLSMKIGDVEYQGDGTKAIFYYIADERVDFRQLIKVLAENFRIRVEMKQIGARQEAGRIGGIGPCGRELCCCTWMGNFVSVTTTSARYQEISLNPQKLAGQCSKLKCCLNYELDCYIDAQKNFPPTNIPLETERGKYIFLKADIFKGIFWYGPEVAGAGNQVAISIDRVKEIIRLNKTGKKIEDLKSDNVTVVKEELGYANVIEEDDLTRFDKGKRQSNEKRKRPHGSRQHNKRRGQYNKPKGNRNDRNPEKK